MKVTGITAEYDPMHNGHLYQLQTAKAQSEADCVIVVIGGDFLQRGRPGYYDKRIRAEMAVRAGADLVIQLPYIYSCSSGNEYAAGAVSILNGLGCVDFISFGCEAEHIEVLEKAAQVLPDEEPFAGYIREYQSKGLSYPESLTRVIADHAGQEAADAVRSPNNLLAVEYIRALNRSRSDIKILPVRRTPGMPVSNGSGRSNARADAAVSGDALRTLGTDISSAGDIRRFLRANGSPEALLGYLPDAVYEVMNRPDIEALGPEDEERMFRMLVYRILTMDMEQLSGIFTVSEGIGSRVRDAAYHCRSLEEMTARISTRRYTRARVRRMLTHILMGFRTSEFDELRGTCYARILGLSENGRELLRSIRGTSSIPVLSNLYRMERYDEKVISCIDLDCRASDLSMMIRGRYDQIGSEKSFVPYIGKR